MGASNRAGGSAPHAQRWRFEAGSDGDGDTAEVRRAKTKSAGVADASAAPTPEARWWVRHALAGALLGGFAGVLIAANLQRSHLGGTPLDGSLDLFAIAVPSTERESTTIVPPGWQVSVHETGALVCEAS